MNPNKRFLKAKDFAAEITIHNARSHEMGTEHQRKKYKKRWEQYSQK